MISQTKLRLLTDLNFLCSGLGSTVGKTLFSLQGTRGHEEFISPDKEKNCRFAFLRIIFCSLKLLFCFFFSTIGQAFLFLPLIFHLLIFFCVCDRERDCVGEILYPIFGNIWKEIDTIKGYVRITGQPGITAWFIHLL